MLNKFQTFRIYFSDLGPVAERRGAVRVSVTIYDDDMKELENGRGKGHMVLEWLK